jgi:general secretion pathway protein H
MKTRHRGFTLLEMLVVVSMLAILAVGVSLSLSSNNPRTLHEEALRLRTLLELAADESRITGATVLWSAPERGYRFDRLAMEVDNDFVGKSALDERLRPRTLPDGVMWGAMVLEARPLAAGGQIPFVAGSVAPFSIRLEQGERTRLIEGRVDGTIVLSDAADVAKDKP